MVCAGWFKSKSSRGNKAKGAFSVSIRTDAMGSWAPMPSILGGSSFARNRTPLWTFWWSFWCCKGNHPKRAPSKKDVTDPCKPLSLGIACASSGHSTSLWDFAALSAGPPALLASSQCRCFVCFVLLRANKVTLRWVLTFQGR